MKTINILKVAFNMYRDYSLGNTFIESGITFLKKKRSGFTLLRKVIEKTVVMILKRGFTFV